MSSTGMPEATPKPKLDCSFMDSLDIDEDLDLYLPFELMYQKQHHPRNQVWDDMELLEKGGVEQRCSSLSSAWSTSTSSSMTHSMDTIMIETADIERRHGVKSQEHESMFADNFTMKELPQYSGKTEMQSDSIDLATVRTDEIFGGSTILSESDSLDEYHNMLLQITNGDLKHFDPSYRRQGIMLLNPSDHATQQQSQAINESTDDTTAKRQDPQTSWFEDNVTFNSTTHPVDFPLSYDRVKSASWQNGRGQETTSLSQKHAKQGNSCRESFWNSPGDVTPRVTLTRIDLRGNEKMIYGFKRQ